MAGDQDLGMVLCHSMNANSVGEYHGVVGTLKPYLMQTNLLNILHLQMMGMQNLLMGQLTPGPPREFFTNFYSEL